MADPDFRALRRDLRFGGRQIPSWLALACLTVGVPLACYSWAHIEEWPRRGPGGGEGANHLAAVAGLVGDPLVLVAVIVFGLRLARWIGGRASQS